MHFVWLLTLRRQALVVPQVIACAIKHLLCLLAEYFQQEVQEKKNEKT